MRIRSSAMWVAAFLLGGCAQVKPPTGGPKDTTPPQLVQAVPPNGSLNFSDDRILLEFDERIKLDGIHQQLLISPPLEQRPKVQMLGGSKVLLSDLGPLLPNTTYTFNFGDAVVDLTEGNATAALTYVVSTGDELDQRSIHGKVLNAFTGQPEEAVLVLIHSTADTGDVRTTRPRYFDRTDEEGRYQLAYLAAGEYQITALRDNNANYLYDLPNEEIAFQEGTIELAYNDSLITGVELQLFLAEASEQFMQEAKVMKTGGFQIVTSRYSPALQLQPIEEVGKDFHFLLEQREGSDTSFWWPSDTTALRGKRFQVMDGEQIIDTVEYRLFGKPDFGPALTVTGSMTIDSVDLRISSNKPIISLDTSRVMLTADSTSVPFTYHIGGAAKRRIDIRLDEEQDGLISALFLPKSVKDMYGGHNDTLRTTIGTNNPADLGHIVLELDSLSAAHHVLQLIDAQQRVVQEEKITTRSPVQHWDKVSSGKYRIRLIVDNNKNGRWDTGSFDPQRMPELVFMYPEEVQVRAGWKLELRWVLSDGSTSSP